MSTIAAYEKEIMMQLEYLQNFKPQQMLSNSKQKKTIFCGTGDSYASALLAEVFSQFKAKAHDPLDLLKNKSLVKNHDLYLISISGNTVSNIRLGRLTKNSTAITANNTSRLAEACKKVIQLRFENTRIQTSGSISFLASALTCISLVSRYKNRESLKIFEHAKKISKKISLHGKVYILGNMHTFPVAFFFAAKLHEVLGMDAHYERIEQFSHAGLFATKRGDTVILFEKKNLHNEKLLKHLQSCKLNAIRIDPPKTNLLGKILFFIFVSELVTLYAAKKKKKKECYFVEAKQLKDASSSMIY
jgi:fructoselysine-6-P-deglycase FrlB-like protein